MRADQQHEELTTSEDIPAEVQSHLERVVDLADISVAISTDLRSDGTYGTDWVCATEDQLIRCSHNGAAELHVQTFPLKDVEQLEVRALQGNNILKVRTATEAVEVARFSKKLAPKFDDAVDAVEKLDRKSVV